MLKKRASALEIKPYLKDLYRTKPNERSRKGYLRMDMNESIMGLPESFLKKTFSRVTPDFLASYPEYSSLQKKIAKHNNLKPENIGLANGSDAAIKYIFDAYVSTGDKILLTDPTFAMYPVYCRMYDAELIVVTYNSDLTFPVESFINKISDDIKIAVVVNPNNPTGAVIEQSALFTIIKKCADNGVLIIVDEAYFYFYPKTVIGAVNKYKNLIVLRTFSKLCGMAAARLGYAASNGLIIEGLRKVKPTYDVNGLALLLAEKLLDNQHIIKDLIKATDEGKKYLVKKLSSEGIEYKAGEANFILIKCNNRVEEMISRLADKRILVNGGFKQEFLKDYIRVTVGDKTYMKQFWNSFSRLW